MYIYVVLVGMWNPYIVMPNERITTKILHFRIMERWGELLIYILCNVTASTDTLYRPATVANRITLRQTAIYKTCYSLIRYK